MLDATLTPYALIIFMRHFQHVLMISLFISPPDLICRCHIFFAIRGRRLFSLSLSLFRFIF